MLSTIKIKHSFDVFISYHFDIETNVLELFDIIGKYFTANIAISKLLVGKHGADIPFEKICNLIDVSKRIICCITKSFLKTNYCLNELMYSIQSNKPIIFILFEDISLDKIKIKNPIKCNLFNDLNSFDSRSGNVYDELILCS